MVWERGLVLSKWGEMSKNTENKEKGCKWSVSNEKPQTQEMFLSALEKVSETTFVELHSQAKDIQCLMQAVCTFSTWLE